MMGRKILVKSLFIYPIKSIGGIKVESAVAQEKGFAGDRKWMLVDEQGKFITQRELPKMAQIGASMNGDGFEFFKRQDSAISINILKSPELFDTLKVQIWSSELIAYELDHSYSHWFSEQLHKKVKLVSMGEKSSRTFYIGKHQQKVSLNFPDGYPYLVLGQASVDFLNSKLEQPLHVNRFRTNILLDGLAPHEEDRIQNFKINGHRFLNVKPCARCSIITTDQHTGKRYKEPLNTLATYRKTQNEVYFGMNAIVFNKGQICKGDVVTLTHK